MYCTPLFFSMNINLVPTPSDSVFCLSELSPTLHLYSPSEIRGLRSCKGVAHELNPTPSLHSASVLADFVPAISPLVGVLFLCVGLASGPLSRPYIASELVGVGPDLTVYLYSHLYDLISVLRKNLHHYENSSSIPERGR